MHKLLQEYLYKKYPKIFADKDKPMSETCMCWGICTGNGWFSLIDSLCGQIQHHIDNPPYEYDEEEGCYKPATKPTCPQLVADQVKEKFSSLRFYYHGGDEYCHALVNNAEDMSYFICEDCGKMDETVGRNKKGWIVTTCREHARNPDDFIPNRSELGDIWKQVREDEEKEREKEKKWAEEWKTKQQQEKE